MRSFSQKVCRLAARTLRLQIHVLHATSERDFDNAFTTLAELKASGLVFIDKSEQLAVLALRHAIPAFFLYREFVAAGGLMSYRRSTR